MKHLKTYNIFPEQITHEFNYLKIDNRYICTYAIVGFSNEITFISTIDLLYKYKNTAIPPMINITNEIITVLATILNVFFILLTRKSLTHFLRHPDNILDCHICQEYTKFLNHLFHLLRELVSF